MSNLVEQYTGSTEFTHLHSHSLFSMLDGVAKPEEYFQSCSERQWPAMAITEHGVFSSIPDAYWASKEHKVKYIVGCEFYFNDYEPLRRKLSDKGITVNKLKEKYPKLTNRMRRNRHLTVLCKNQVGYENILKVNQLAWKHGYYYKPRVWFDLLAQYSEGLIVLSGCLNGPMAHEIRSGNIDDDGRIIGAASYLKKFDEVFGDDFYIELQMPCLPESSFGGEHLISDRDVFHKLVEMAKDNKKTVVMTCDSHYMSREDFTLQKAMMAIDQGLTIDDPDLFHVNSNEQFFKTPADLWETFKTEGYDNGVDDGVFHEACRSTVEIADKCDYLEFDTSPKLPHVSDANKRLVTEAFAGLREKGLDKVDRKYLVDGNEVSPKEQMVIELNRIIEKGYSSYFIITKDLIDKARAKYGHGGVGPGRGSAAGSLLCYLLGIVDLNPLEWGLSFSRFLSPARGGKMLKVSMDE